MHRRSSFPTAHVRLQSIAQLSATVHAEPPTYPSLNESSTCPDLLTAAFPRRARNLTLTFLTELRLSLLDGSDNHVTGSSGGQAVKTSSDTVDGNDEKVLRTAVVSAVHHCTDRQGEGLKGNGKVEESL